MTNDDFPIRRRGLGSVPIPAYADLIAQSRTGFDRSKLDASGVPQPGFGELPDSDQNQALNLFQQYGIPDGAQLSYLDPVQLAMLLDAIQPWRGNLRMRPFVANIVPAVLLPADERRKYFLIVNTDLLNRIFLGFDIEPGAATGLPIEANLGAYEPAMIPLNTIYVSALVNATPGICIYAT